MQPFRFPPAFATLLLLASLSSAQSSGFSRLTEGISSICGQFMTFLPPLAILLVVVAAVFYGSGKLVPNAEFSNRATNMAAAAAVGAVLCLVIVLLVPSILQALYGGPMNCGAQTWG